LQEAGIIYFQLETIREYLKKSLKLLVIAVITSVIIVSSSCQSESVISYSDNPNWAQIQKEEFVEYKSDFEYVTTELLEHKSTLNGWIITYDPVFTNGKIDVWKPNKNVFKTGKENKKYIKLFNEDKTFFKSIKTIFYKMGDGDVIESGPLKGKVFSDGGYVDSIHIYNDALFFSSGDSSEDVAVNYIAYTIDGNPPSHGIQPGEELHIKEYAPHWFSVVEGEPRY
jgi:hypothetical protein